ncbi:hypothetical protein DFJ74DRAFT_714467 [Hyaloraphidium curvatum]|nr:hypothetical protein DFJ74DRAFT_714467 [Hyaloraphidium curvatum]
MVALLVAVYVGRGPDGSTSAFATAAVGILFGYVHYPLIALRHHWVTSAPLFSAADSKDLSCAPHAYTARYWTVMGQSKRGVEEGRNAVLAVNVASFVVFFTWMHGHTSFANMSVTRLSAEFGRASERIGAALVELASSAGSPPTVQAMTTDPSRAYLFAALSAELAAHRDELRRLATTLPRIKAFGFDLTFSALRTGGLAALTVGAALYQAFRLRIQLGTFCKP